MEKLKHDKTFVPVSLEEGEEYYPNGIFIFNISKLRAAILHDPTSYDKHKISVAAYHVSKTDWNEQYVMDADLSRPILLAEIRPDRFVVIDGRHRLEKAKRTGITELEAYFLRPRQFIPFMTTQKGYDAFIIYWNGKVDDDIRDKRYARLN